jgi:alanine racemase
MGRLPSEELGVTVLASPSGAAATGALGGVLRPAWADVDLDALAANLRHARQRVAPAHVLAVIKAGAYGHGAVPVARALEAEGVDWLGVALVEEGADLRRGGVEAPVLVLGVAQPEQLPFFRRYRLTPTVSSREQLEMWLAWSAAGGGARQPIHLKVDTGMTRLGLDFDEAAAALERVRRSAGLELTGLLSHLADADLVESEHNPRQIGRFNDLLELLLPAERERVLCHLANSAGALHHPPSRHDLVRLGLALYGLDPALREGGLRPVMAVRARIVSLREVPDGAALGYGGRRVTLRPSRIAVVPAGYADGYSWRLSDRAEALVRGRRAPVAGSVSMDMTMLDVTDVEAELGDEVTLLGRQGEDEISAAELARIAGTLPYEFLCLLGLRLTRRYWRGGVVVEEQSRFVRTLP